MNTKEAALAVLAISGCLAPGLVACGSSSLMKETIPVIDTGRAAWAARKATCAAYHYDRSTFGQVQFAITGVQISGDIPVWRSYIEPDHFNDAGPPTAWLEEGADVGSHTSGFPALTVEQLYDGCEAVRSALQVGSRGQAGSLEVSVTDGVPYTCGWPDGCGGTSCANEIDLIGFSCGSIDPGTVAGASNDAGRDTD